MNNFLSIKSINRATSRRGVARIISIMILALLWPARGEAQTPPGSLNVSTLSFTESDNSVTLTCSDQGAWTYKGGGKVSETPFNGTLTGTQANGKVFYIKSNKVVTGDTATYPKLILDNLNYTSSGAVFEMASDSKPVYIQTKGASKLISTGLGTGDAVSVIYNDWTSLVIDGGSNGLEIEKDMISERKLYGIEVTNLHVDIMLQGKITVKVHNAGAGSSSAIIATNDATLSYGESANIQCTAQSGIFTTEKSISSPFLEWTFAGTPAGNKTLEIRDANGTPFDPAITFTTNAKAKSFTISAKANTDYTLWLDGKKQMDSNRKTVFTATDDNLFSFSGIKEYTPPSNWYEYAQTAKVGLEGTDVTVSDNTHYTVHTSAGLAWIAWVTNEGKNNAAEADKYYPATAGFAGCTVTLANDIALTAPTTGVVTSGFDASWPTIGKDADYLFKGTFDGGNHKVSDLSLTIPNSRQCNGLFGYILDADIKNLRVEGNIGGDDCMDNDIFVGGIVGMANNSSKIIACSNAVEISVTKTTTNGELNIGGIVGFLNASKIYSCWNEASLRGTSPQKLSIGGIVGRSNSSISNCYSSGPVSGTGTSTSACASGGIVGYIESTVVSNCYATGSVSATNALDGSTTSAGGIAGHIKNARVFNCLALNIGENGITSSANGGTSHVGRIAGQQEDHLLPFDNNYASTKIKLKKGSDPAAAPTTEIGAKEINGADVYLDDVADAIASWTGSENTKAFTAIDTVAATGMLPQLKAVTSLGEDGLPSAYGGAIASQPAANMKSADYLGMPTALELPASSLTITLSYTDGKWRYNKGDGAPIRFTGTVKMAQGVTSSDIPLVVTSATGNPTLTFEEVKLGTSENKSLLTINDGCELTLHTTGDKPLTLTSSGTESNMINKGTLTLTGTGLFIEHFNSDLSYCLENSGTFTVSNPGETSVIFDCNRSPIFGNGTLGNAWIEWHYNNGGKIAFAAIDDTNQSPDAQTFKRGKIATPVTPGKTYRLWKVTGESPNEVRTRQTGTKDSKTVAFFPAPAANEVAVYTDVKDVITNHIRGIDNFSKAEHSGNDVIVYSGGKLTITNTDTDAQVLNLTLKEGGQVVTTKPLKVIETFSTTRTLGNKWIAFGSPVAMKASVKEEGNDRLLYVGTGYTDAASSNQVWENVSGIPETGTKTADLAADSPYLLAAELNSTTVTFTATASTAPLEIPETATVAPGNALADGVFLFRTNPNLANLTLSNIYVLSSDGTRFEYHPGDYTVKPFEAYITANEETCSRVRSLKIGDNIATGIDRPLTADTRIWGTRGTLHISAEAPADVLIVTPAGRTLRSLKASAGETTLALPSGIYFVRCNGITYKVSL